MSSVTDQLLWNSSASGCQNFLWEILSASPFLSEVTFNPLQVKPILIKIEVIDAKLYSNLS